MHLSRTFYFILALIFIAFLIVALFFLRGACPARSDSALPQKISLAR